MKIKYITGTATTFDEIAKGVDHFHRTSYINMR